MTKIAIIGLGYVGLPLACEFSKKYQVVGFDLNEKRTSELLMGVDRTNEISIATLKSLKNIFFTSKLVHLSDCNIFIVTVPTPVTQENIPDLTALKSASKIVGGNLNKGDLVVFESTVYPGATEEICIPLLEKYSGLVVNKDFDCGYSPERINPGDANNTLTHIVKITSGNSVKAADRVDRLYNDIIEAGTFKAESIKVAEAAKVIENTQRDLNIALVNELALIFDRLAIDTQAVLDAASTKWNFNRFTPGLVGGHCIGVDPYYLTYKAKALGYNSELILAGRRLNDEMHALVAHKFMKSLNLFSGNGKKRTLILGATFKENCNDIRNSRVFKLIEELEEFGICVDLHDPLAAEEDIKNKHNIQIVKKFRK